MRNIDIKTDENGNRYIMTGMTQYGNKKVIIPKEPHMLWVCRDNMTGGDGYICSECLKDTENRNAIYCPYCGMKVDKRVINSENGKVW